MIVVFLKHDDKTIWYWFIRDGTVFMHCPINWRFKKVILSWNSIITFDYCLPTVLASTHDASRISHGFVSQRACCIEVLQQILDFNILRVHPFQRKRRCFPNSVTLFFFVWKLWNSWGWKQSSPPRLHDWCEKKDLTLLFTYKKNPLHINNYRRAELFFTQIFTNFKWPTDFSE